MANAKAKWTIGTPSKSVDKTSGTAAASVPLLDNGTIAATLTFTITADRALRVEVDNAAGSAGFTDFQAWMRSV